MTLLFQALFLILRILEGAIFVYFLSSLFAPHGTFTQQIGRILSPVLLPFRVLNQKLLGRFALPVDFSLMFALIGIDVIYRLLAWLFNFLI